MNFSLLKYIKSFSAISLIIANMFPLFAVLFLGWDIFMVLFLYLAETAIIGVYGILKLIIVAKFWSIFIVPLFIFAYGMIMLVPFVIIGGISDSHYKSPQDTVNLINDLKSGIITYLISHGISFLWNYIGKREYRKMTIESQMIASYQRIILIFVAAFAGFFLYIMKETPGQFMFALAIFSLPLVIIFLAIRLRNWLKGEVKIPVHREGNTKPKITLKKIGVVLAGMAVFGALLISPAISMLIFLIFIKTAVDLYSHLKEHDTM